MTKIYNTKQELMFEDESLSLKELVEKNKSNLKYADLRFADLGFADLRFANLFEADLREANLREADLNEANLEGADLEGADLRHVRYSSQLVKNGGNNEQK